MKKSKVRLFAHRYCIPAALGLCLLCGLILQPVKSTASYITSLSMTCVNTFTAEKTQSPSTPEQPENPDDTPPTGDDSHWTWYLLGAGASLGGIALIWKTGRKSKNKSEEQ